MDNNDDIDEDNNPFLETLGITHFVNFCSFMYSA